MGKFTLPRDGGLIEAGLPNGIKHSYERIPAHIFEDEEAACARLAEKIVESINACKFVPPPETKTAILALFCWRAIKAFILLIISFAYVEFGIPFM